MEFLNNFNVHATINMKFLLDTEFSILYDIMLLILISILMKFSAKILKLKANLGPRESIAASLKFVVIFLIINISASNLVS